VLHVTRPYENEEAYIQAEAWTVDTRSMLLIDQAPIPADTVLTFAVTLGDGSRPIKAEAKVTGSVEPKDGRPGGLRVRFKRYGAPTKAFIERAMALVASGAGSGFGTALAAPLPGAPNQEPSSPEPSVVEVSSPVAAEAPVAAAPVAEAPVAEAAPLPATTAGGFEPVRVSPSGRPLGLGLAALRARKHEVPETPSNREYLLEKLRQRDMVEDVTSRYQQQRADDEVTLFYRRPEGLLE
jgi:hypothetical protein